MDTARAEAHNAWAGATRFAGPPPRVQLARVRGLVVGLAMGHIQSQEQCLSERSSLAASAEEEQMGGGTWFAVAVAGEQTRLVVAFIR